MDYLYDVFMKFFKTSRVWVKVLLVEGQKYVSFHKKYIFFVFQRLTKFIQVRLYGYFCFIIISELFLCGKSCITIL